MQSTIDTVESPKTQQTSALEHALKYASMGLRVFPLQPRTKRPSTEHGVKDATTDPATITAWWTENPDAGIGLAPDLKVGGACFLEFDQKPTLKDWARNEGQPMPETRVHRSGGKGAPHFIFTHTEKSLALGNCDGSTNGHEWFSFRAANRYIVAPPSIHPDSGKPYTVAADIEPTTIPDWVVDRIRVNGTREQDFAGGMPEVDEDFDIEGFFNWIPVGTGIEDGSWIPFMECPVVGRRHKGQGVRGCALFYDGGRLGFKCQAANCPSNTDRKPNQSGIGFLVSFLSEENGAYDGVIWPRQSDEELALEFGAVSDDAPEPLTSPETLAIQTRELSEDIAPDAFASSAATSEARGGSLEFPDDCMYGAAAEMARQLKVPRGLAYPALIGCWSVKPDIDKMVGTRVNVTVALCAPVGGGKNVAMDRAQRLLGLVKDAEYKKAAPAGTRALMSMLGDKPAGGKNSRTAPRVPGPRKMLLITHEMTDVLKMTGIDNSTLASRLCDMWDDNEFEYPTKEGVISVDCRLSWVGGVPCSADNPTRFTELFGSETSHGLYDRLIIGYSDARFNYRDWQPPTEAIAGDFENFVSEAPGAGYVAGLSEEAEAMFEAWNPEGGGSRIRQNCMKVAVLTTMMNHEEIVNVECVRCAIRFMEWQIEVKKVFQPGEAVNDAARCRTMILDAMERKFAMDRYINIKRLAHDRKWAKKFGDWLVSSVIKSLAEMGEIVPEIEDVLDKHGDVVKQKESKTMFKLRDFSAT